MAHLPSSSSRSSRVLPEIAAFAAYLGGALCFTYPLLLALPETVTDLADPLLNAWALGWVLHQLPRSPLHLFDANIFFPESGTLAFSEHLLGVALLVAPVQFVFGKAILTHNMALVASIALSGYGMYRLGRWLTCSSKAGLVAGSIFAFAPYRLGHLSHLQIQATGFIPLVFLCLGRYVDEGRIRHAVGLGVFLWLTSASCGYFGVFTWILLGVAVPYEIARARIGDVHAVGSVSPLLSAYRLLPTFHSPCPTFASRGTLGSVAPSSASSAPLRIRTATFGRGLFFIRPSESTRPTWSRRSFPD